MKWESDELGLGSTPYAKFNIAGQSVEVRRFEHASSISGWRVHFCTYVKLKNARYLNLEYLDTYREGDWVGVDTAHGWNENMTEAQKLADSLNQIEKIIELWKTNIREEEV